MNGGMTELRHRYLRHHKKFPHVWCPGCGNGIVLGALLRTVARLRLEKDDIVFASGIGCSGRMSTYVDFNTLHTTHGRALTFATGIKLAKPDLKVIAVMGDGDATAIGGNHFIHAARRNIDLTAIIINNQIYGMTGGQASPTTPYGARSTTSAFSNIEHAFSIAELAVAAGRDFDPGMPGHIQIDIDIVSLDGIDISGNRGHEAGDVTGAAGEFKDVRPCRHHGVHQRHGDLPVRVSGGHKRDQGTTAPRLEVGEPPGDAAHRVMPSRAATVCMSLSPRPDRLTRMIRSLSMPGASLAA